MSNKKDLEIRQEYFENEGTGVEQEEETESAIEEPWNPDEIRVTSKNFSLRNILDMIDEQGLELAPDFQRQKVWKPAQKSRLIESILLRIPLPAFYFSEEPDGRMKVVDGLQRLSAIHDFTQTKDDNGFELSGLEYLDEVKGKRFSDLALSWRRRLYNTQIFVHIIDPETPDAVKFNIFKRINTGGTPLNAQEIRHCMSGQRSREFLKRCISTSEFNQATMGVLKNHVRMADREVVLRFCAFWLLEDISEYAEHDTMDAFLTDATRKIDRILGQEILDQLLEKFKRAMRNAYRIFGEHAFRKWPLYSDARSPINRALFETWSVGLSNYEWEELQPHRNAIIEEARRLMTNDQRYIDSISTATGDLRRVNVRFSRLQDLTGKFVS